MAARPSSVPLEESSSRPFAAELQTWRAATVQRKTSPGVFATARLVKSLSAVLLCREMDELPDSTDPQHRQNRCHGFQRDRSRLDLKPGLDHLNG